MEFRRKLWRKQLLTLDSNLLAAIFRQLVWMCLLIFLHCAEVMIPSIKEMQVLRMES